MAEHLAAIHGTEKDKVNCAFYAKIGACRHGERCNRKHNKPLYSTVLLLPNFYSFINGSHNSITPSAVDFDTFYEDMWIECATRYGPIEDIKICENVSDHLTGNVYIRFEAESYAAAAVTDLGRRFYAGRPIYVELSPVTEFRDACCRQHESGECDRAGFCNFLHVREPMRGLIKSLRRAQYSMIKQRHQQEAAKRSRDSRHERDQPSSK